VVVVLGGCALPDYAKVDGGPTGAGSGGGSSGGGGASDSGGSGVGAETGDPATCCSDEGCDDTAILDCVCAADSACCEEGWDGSCANQIEALGCGDCGGQTFDEDLPQPQSCGEVQTCDENTPVCVDEACAQCASDRDCGIYFPDFPFCVQSECAECKADADCQAIYEADFPYCIGGLCAQCTSDADCPNSTCAEGSCEE
jgi:hypothetical protein